MYKQAREERDQLLKEAKVMKETIISDAKKSAEEEGKRIIQAASEEINKQKAVAIAELKGQVASMSIAIAEKLIGNQLADNDQQKTIITSHINDLNNTQQANA